jgi:hypothetical protein
MLNQSTVWSLYAMFALSIHHAIRSKGLGLVLGFCLSFIGSSAVHAATPVVRKDKPPVTPATTAATTAPDVELWLRGCPSSALRNAKLYAVRIIGIDLMKRSAERNQGRSATDIERQFTAVLEQLGKRNVADAQLQQLEDAFTVLMELTIQNPLVNQIEPVSRVAERIAASCAKVQAQIEPGSGNGGSPIVLRDMIADMLTLSQRIAMEQLLPFANPRIKALSSADPMAKMEAHIAAFHKAVAHNPKLADTVQLLDGQWVFFKLAVLSDHTISRNKAQDIGRSSELIYELLDAELSRQRRP